MTEALSELLLLAGPGTAQQPAATSKRKVNHKLSSVATGLGFHQTFPSAEMLHFREPLAGLLFAGISIMWSK